MNLDKFNKKIKKEAIIKSIIFGFASSLLLNSIVIVLFKLIGIKILIALHIVTFILLAIGFTYLFYNYVFKENEKKVVNRLENCVKLHESVKTMVEFKDIDEPMVNLQRKDTNKKLENVSEKQLKYKFSPFVFIFASLSFVSLVVSILVPPKEIYSQGVNDSSSSNEDSSSNPSSDESSSDSQEQQEEAVLFNATSSADANLYFKILSYGDYDTKEFLEPTNSFDSSSSIINPMYLTSKALESNGYTKDDILIEVIEGNSYFLPYYTTNGPKSPTNDYMIIEDYSKPYSLSYIQYNYLQDGIIKHKDKDYIAFEATYGQFVKDNYLTLPATTKTLMQNIIDESGLDINSSTIISDVINYINSVATYGEGMDISSYPENEDSVIYFLTTALQGTSDIFAMTATVMYRTLGIPARYTFGAYSPVSKNQTVEVKQAYHAWVEVYIDGMGWINIESTTSQQQSATLFNATSDVDGGFYFKLGSYGNYNKQAFDILANQFDSSSLLDNPMNLTGKALEDNGYEFNNVLIETVDAQNYYSTYFTNNNPKNQANDYIIDADYLTPYTLSFTNYNYFEEGVKSHTDAAYIDLENTYRTFVYENYLSLPDDTKTQMDMIIADYEIDTSSQTLISDVVTLITSNATYDPEITYDSYPSDADTAIYFFSESMQGNIAIFVTAATVMYRALGIPARATVGFYSALKADELTPVMDNQGHMWVEVYIDGMGWIPVELMPGGMGQGEGEGGEEGDGEQEEGTGDGQEGDGDGEESGDEEPGNGSSGGEGKLEYASDDLIYDPETNQYVTYGELLTWYYSQALNGVQDGKIPEDLTEIINDYFSSLFSDPTPDEPEEEQGN